MNRSVHLSMHSYYKLRLSVSGIILCICHWKWNCTVCKGQSWTCLLGLICNHVIQKKKNIWFCSNAHIKVMDLFWKTKQMASFLLLCCVYPVQCRCCCGFQERSVKLTCADSLHCQNKHIIMSRPMRPWIYLRESVMMNHLKIIKESLMYILKAEK